MLEGEAANQQQQDAGEIKTLFITGFPHDVKEREIHNLFRFIHGYEGFKLNFKAPKGPVAFVTFHDNPCALSAQSTLQGVQFDPEFPVVLYIELARSNSKPKRPFIDDVARAAMDVKRKRVEYPGATTAAYDPYPHYQTVPHPGYMAPPPYAYWDYVEPTRHQAPPPQPIPYSYGQIHTPQAQTSHVPPPQHHHDNPPCNTLYVTNIDPVVPEAEISAFFGALPGFKRLKMTPKFGYLVAFVEFESETLSTTALKTYNGQTMGSQPMRIEYARSKMGEKTPKFGFMPPPPEYM